MASSRCRYRYSTRIASSTCSTLCGMSWTISGGTGGITGHTSIITNSRRGRSEDVSISAYRAVLVASTTSLTRGVTRYTRCGSIPGVEIRSTSDTVSRLIDTGATWWSANKCSTGCWSRPSSCCHSMSSGTWSTRGSRCWAGSRASTGSITISSTCPRCWERNCRHWGI